MKNVAAAIKAEQEAFDSFDDLLRDRSVRETVSHALDLVHFKYGEVLLTAGQGERAAREFLAAARAENAEPALVTMAHLYAGRGFDLVGKRDDALAHYRQVLASTRHLRRTRGREEGNSRSFQTRNGIGSPNLTSNVQGPLRSRPRRIGRRGGTVSGLPPSVRKGLPFRYLN